MKIRIITCHDVYNYGASLQAYALMTYLDSMSHDVRIIDYKPDYLSHHYDFWHVDEKNRYYNLCQKNKFIKFLYCLRLSPITFATWRRKKPFDEFKKQYLYCTRSYNSLKALQSNPPMGDLYIAGSDQIWNCNLPNGKDPAFYLNFGNPIRKISYAASFAMNSMPSECRDDVSSYLRNLHAISVRESSGLNIVRDLGYDGETVIDPVYLLSKEDWDRFSKEKRLIENDYILVYNLNQGNSNIIHKEAKRLSVLYRLPIVAIDSSFKCCFSNRNIHNAGPIEFVNLIKNANYIVTDSFHGMSFSIIMQRPFCVMHNHSDSSRIKDMLSDLGLEDCLNNQIKDMSDRWNCVSHRIEDKVYSAKAFLVTNINNVEYEKQD